MNGSLAMDSLEPFHDEKLVRDGEEAREEVEVRPTASEDGGPNEANSELRNSAVTGSNVQISHLSRVALVNPDGPQSDPPIPEVDFDFPCERALRLTPTNVLLVTPQQPLSHVTSANGTSTAFRQTD